MLSTSACTACTGSKVVTWLAYTTVRSLAVEVEAGPDPPSAVAPPAQADNAVIRQAAAPSAGMRRRAARWSEMPIGDHPSWSLLASPQHRQETVWYTKCSEALVSVGLTADQIAVTCSAFRFFWQTEGQGGGAR